ncbi:MAG: hypothetical protein JXB42_00225 [Deltaproteobacteria bacterium]|nr:hypothetical protein [Deltaproteobacteria bacterium]
MEPQIIIISVAALMVVFLLLFGGRIRANYGRLKPSAEVAANFEKYVENPDLIYYTSGPESYPTALMGIGRSFALDSNLWNRRTFAKGEFKDLILGMQQKASELNLSLHGFTIMDETNHRIGDWYSVLGIHIVIKTTAPGRLSITTPPHDIYDGVDGNA